MSRVRIVGGTLRSRLIEVPDAIGLRPTPDRVRETLFNWLGQDLTDLACLDLFAGSGALGFEAASRGARNVVMVEQSPKVLAHLRKSLATLKIPNVKIIAHDAIKFLESTTEQFDVVFLDPPYRQGWLERVEPLLVRLLRPGAKVYVESETPVAQLAHMAAVRAGQAGQVHYQLLEAPLEERKPAQLDEEAHE